MIHMKIDIIKDSLVVLLGNAILALGVSFFIIPNDILTGGLPGIAIALEPVFHWNPTLVIDFLTVFFFVVGAIFFGKKFAVQTALSTICYPLFLTLFASFASEFYIDDIYLATIFGGVFMGVGVGLVFSRGASTGGVDVIPLLLHKFTHLPLAKLVLATDAVTVLLGLPNYGLKSVLIGTISVWVSSYMIDRTLMLGGQKMKNVLIISDHYHEIKEMIHSQLVRGTTLVHATGGYSQQEKKILMAVVNQHQYPKLNQMVSTIDPKAFIVVMDATEVQGLGFTYEEYDL